MKRRICLCLLFFMAACGKKEWPQPIASEEMLFIDHVEARLEQQCLLINAKLGGNLINLEFFQVEIEEEGCPTCPFTPHFSRTVYPFSSAVERKENSFLIHVCQPFSTSKLRIRLTADNTHSVIDPAVSKVVDVIVKE